jgi:hypothetical protein
MSCFSSFEEYQMTLGMTKYETFLHMGQALNVELTSIPEAGELPRQFLMHDMQNG